MITFRSQSRSALAAAALVVVALGLAACGSSGSSGTTPPPAAGGSSQAAKGRMVRVTLKNFSVTVAGGNHLTPGTYTFLATNTSGGTGHNLTISGPGVKTRATPTFTRGAKRLTVTLRKGTYTFFCSIHRAMGMTTTVTVAPGSGSGGGAPATSGGSSSSGGSWA